MAFYLFCCFLLQLLFGAVHSGTEMFAFSGMSFPLFSNLTSHEHVTLYQNGKENNDMIVSWRSNDTKTNPKYKGKFFLERDKTLVIWICNVDLTDSGKYIVQYGLNPGPELELYIIKNKQLDVCLNSPPNSPEKSFGRLDTDQIVQIKEMLDNHSKDIKDHLETRFSQIMDALLCYAIILIVLMVIVILIIMVKKHIIAWIQCKKINRNNSIRESMDKEGNYSDIHSSTR